MGRWLPLWVMLGALLAGGCASDSGPKPAELKPFKEQAQAKVAWRYSVGDSGPYVFSPVIWDGDVFVAATGGTLARVDARNGKARWRINTKVKLSGGVEARDGLVIVGSTKGAVLAFGLDGKPLWQVQISSESLGPASIADGTVVVRSGDGRVHGLDAATGARRWEYIATVPPLLIRTPAGVAIDRGAVYAGLPGGKMVALSLVSGGLLWEAAVSQPKGDSELERVTDVVSVPIAEDNRACAISFQGRIACFDTQRGSLAWARNASGTGGLGADEKAFYYVDEASSVHAIDRDSGASLWKLDTLAYRGLGAPGAAGRYVAVGDFDGYLHFLDRDDGTIAARLSTDGGPITAAPLGVGPGNLLVQTREGSLYAVTVR
ncbi:MAG: outer membrane protein assembly factor BamB [Burkholderiales bacterium]|nr:outer membrane protein assembly factor BamB [Burkholderiales bacterium]